MSATCLPLKLDGGVILTFHFCLDFLANLINLEHDTIQEIVRILALLLAFAIFNEDLAPFSRARHHLADRLAWVVTIVAIDLVLLFLLPRWWEIAWVFLVIAQDLVEQDQVTRG